MYYNTNEESGKTLNNSRRKAETQEEIILDLFKRNPKFHMTPFDIQDAIRALYSVKVPITSVRRAMTDLTTEGWLIKTDIMKKGRYGKEVHCWKAKMQ